MTQLTEDWHGVPAGTEVLVVGGPWLDWHGDTIARICRVDGLRLPHPCGEPQPHTTISTDFLRVA